MERTAYRSKPVDFVYSIGSMPFVKKFFRYWYPLVTRRLSNEDVVFLNWGYEEDPPMGIPLAPADEPNRYCIQLYHRTSAQVDLRGLRVLEVSSGHGGGASYLMRTFGPASYTALELNPNAVDFCRNRHVIPGLEFVHGDAENMPFPDASFDAVINVEASHIYPRFERFLAEVMRVLRPGGHFLYTDMRNAVAIAEWEDALADNPWQICSETEINAEVLRGLAKNSGRTTELIRDTVPVFLRRFAREFAVVEGSWFFRDLQQDKISYRVYHFTKD